MGTVLFTGLEMIAKTASGQNSAQASTKFLTIPALVLNRSSRVIPGFRGTPAGITTTDASFRAVSIPVSWEGGHDRGAGKLPVTEELDGM